MKSPCLPHFPFAQLIAWLTATSAFSPSAHAAVAKLHGYHLGLTYTIQATDVAFATGFRNLIQPGDTHKNYVIARNLSSEVISVPYGYDGVTWDVNLLHIIGSSRQNPAGTSVYDDPTHTVSNIYFSNLKITLKSHLPAIGGAYARLSNLRDGKGIQPSVPWENSLVVRYWDLQAGGPSWLNEQRPVVSTRLSELGISLESPDLLAFVSSAIVCDLQTEVNGFVPKVYTSIQSRWNFYINNRTDLWGNILNRHYLNNGYLFSAYLASGNYYFEITWDQYETIAE